MFKALVLSVGLLFCQQSAPSVIEPTDCAIQLAYNLPSFKVIMVRCNRSHILYVDGRPMRWSADAYYGLVRLPDNAESVEIREWFI